MNSNVSKNIRHRNLEEIKQISEFNYAGNLLIEIKTLLKTAIENNNKHQDIEYIAHGMSMIKAIDLEWIQSIKKLMVSGVAFFEIQTDSVLDNSEFFQILLSDLRSICLNYFRDLKTKMLSCGWIIPDEVAIPENNSRQSMFDEGTTVIFRSGYWELARHEEKGYIYLKRSSLPFASMEVIHQQIKLLTKVFKEIDEKCGIVVDMRNAPQRTDSEFESAMKSLRQVIAENFLYTSLLLSSRLGVLQVNRISREDNNLTFATFNEASAIMYAMGSLSAA